MRRTRCPACADTKAHLLCLPIVRARRRILSARREPARHSSARWRGVETPMRPNRISRAESLILPLVALLVFASPPLFAQVTTGTISGFVVDEQKAAVSGATVTVRNVD